MKPVSNKNVKFIYFKLFPMKVLPCLFQLYSYGGVLEFTILYETSGYSHETHHMSDPDVILQVRFNSPSANTESSLRVVFFVSDLNPGSSTH